MKFLRAAFDRLTQSEFRWVSALFRLTFWWTASIFALIVLFYAAYRMRSLAATIPAVIQAACVALIVIAAVLILAMFRERGRAIEACDRFLRVFADVKSATVGERAGGLSDDKMLLIRRKAATLPGKPGEWWRTLEESMELYTSPGGDEGWFVTRPVSESLTEEDVIDSFYHAGFHQSVPGILTALGLLATFVAILMALAGVTYNALDPIRPVSGIDQLINGLSGKFLSSIIALLLSVVFTFLERKVCDRQLRNAYDDLILRTKSVFPLLTQSRILLDLQRIALAQIPRSHAPTASQRG